MSGTNSVDKLLQFDKIYLGTDFSVGKLRLAPSGLGWKSLVEDKILTIESHRIKKFYWLRVARLFELQVLLKDNKDGRMVRFNGFKKDDLFALKETIKRFYAIQVEQKELCVKGWNWGQTEFDNFTNNLIFLVDDKSCFEIDVNKITNTNLVNKNEVSLEFSHVQNPHDQEDGLTKPPVDELVEVRLFVPNQTRKQQSQIINEQDNNINEEEEEEKSTTAEVFCETIKAKAGLNISAEAICYFQEILLLTPRGRYDIDMFSTFFRLRGKTYDYKIPYLSVVERFLLDRQDDKNILFVISIEPPIRQGQTSYAYLVIEMSKSSEISIDLNLTDENCSKEIQNKIENKNYEGLMYQTMDKIFELFTNKKSSKTTSFKSKLGTSCIKCSIKANEGYMYILEECFLFVPKNPIKINIQDIGTIIFSRVGGGTYLPTARTFDLRFNMKNGNQIQISSINKEEHPLIEEFLRIKNIRFKDELSDEPNAKNTTKYDVDLESNEDDDDDESEDEDFVEKSSNDPPEEFDENASKSSSDSDSKDE